eukprot:6181728-Pleurochrysis_carterae.AAC.1
MLDLNSPLCSVSSSDTPHGPSRVGPTSDRRRRHRRSSALTLSSAACHQEKLFTDRSHYSLSALNPS